MPDPDLEIRGGGGGGGRRSFRPCDKLGGGRGGRRCPKRFFGPSGLSKFASQPFLVSSRNAPPVGRRVA